MAALTWEVMPTSSKYSRLLTSVWGAQLAAPRTALGRGDQSIGAGERVLWPRRASADSWLRRGGSHGVDPDLLTPRSPPSSRVVGTWVARVRDSIVLGGHPQAVLSALACCSQHLRPVAPGLPRRPRAAAFGPGPPPVSIPGREGEGGG